MLVEVEVLPSRGSKFWMNSLRSGAHRAGVPVQQVVHPAAQFLLQAVAGAFQGLAEAGHGAVAGAGAGPPDGLPSP